MVTLNGTTTGLVVDRVADVVTLDASQIKPAPALQGSSSAYIAAIASVDDRMLIMLDVATLIRDLCPAHTEPLAA
jgi:purine-binding chemotaxis protein CheW